MSFRGYPWDMPSERRPIGILSGTSTSQASIIRPSQRFGPSSRLAGVLGHRDVSCTSQAEYPCNIRRSLYTTNDTYTYICQMEMLEFFHRHPKLVVPGMSLRVLGFSRYIQFSGYTYQSFFVGISNLTFLGYVI